VVRWKESKERD